MDVVLETFRVKEASENGLDVLVDITLKEYRRPPTITTASPVGSFLKGIF
jgi:ribosomal protein L11